MSTPLYVLIAWGFIKHRDFMLFAVCKQRIIELSSILIYGLETGKQLPKFWRSLLIIINTAVFTIKFRIGALLSYLTASVP
jgi:hypothetical protein